MRWPSLNANHSERQSWLSSSEYVLVIKQNSKFTVVDNLCFQELRDFLLGLNQIGKELDALSWAMVMVFLGSANHVVGSGLPLFHDSSSGVF